MEPMLVLRSLHKEKHSDICVDRDPFIIGRTPGCQVIAITITLSTLSSELRTESDFGGEILSPASKMVM
jgi:hypothetical protein